MILLQYYTGIQIHGNKDEALLGILWEYDGIEPKIATIRFHQTWLARCNACCSMTKDGHLTTRNHGFVSGFVGQKRHSQP